MVDTKVYLMVVTTVAWLVVLMVGLKVALLEVK